MSKARTARKTDSQIQLDVVRELAWDIRVDPAEIGVSVKNGVVLLYGVVSSFGGKVAVQTAAHRVVGVMDVANDIEVKIPGTARKTDSEIAQAVRSTLEWDVFVDADKITSTATDGVVTLEGGVDTLRDARTWKPLFEIWQGFAM